MIGGAGDHGGCGMGGCMGASGFSVTLVDGIVMNVLVVEKRYNIMV